MSADADYRRIFQGLPTAYLVLTPDLTVVEANPAYLRATMREREDIIGRNVFDAFPPVPDALDSTGVARVQLSFERARDTRRPDPMPLQRYDIADAQTGELVERYWSLIQVPVLDGDQVRYLLQRVEDVTDFVAEEARNATVRKQGEDWHRRYQQAEADLYARAQELAHAVQAKEATARRLAALAEVTLQLAQAQTVADLCEVVTSAGVLALGADGGAVVVSTLPGVYQVTLSGSLGAAVQERYGNLPADSPLAAALSVHGGQALLFPDAAAALAFSPEMAVVQKITGQSAWAVMPMTVAERPLGALAISWTDQHPFAASEVELLTVFATQCAQALDRLQIHDAEQRAAATARRLSETLQRSLLTEPPEPDELEVVVRYRPAVAEAQVGGDWYDAFLAPDGDLTLVIGDVTGHDSYAVAAMGQVRNVLRGVAQSVAGSPAPVLAALDQALTTLRVPTLATVILAQVHQSSAEAAQGLRRVVWSNAGHPPPLLLLPSGEVSVLASSADLLLGFDPSADRADHQLELAPGSVLLLYTDGLVERRGEDLDTGTARLAELLAALADQPLPELCDRLLDALVPEPDDDVALLALRLHPQH